MYEVSRTNPLWVIEVRDDKTFVIADFSNPGGDYLSEETLQERYKRAREYADFLNAKAAYAELDAMLSDMYVDVTVMRTKAKTSLENTFSNLFHTKLHLVWQAIRTLAGIKLAIPTPLECEEKLVYGKLLEGYQAHALIPGTRVHYRISGVGQGEAIVISTGELGLWIRLDQEQNGFYTVQVHNRDDLTILPPPKPEE